MEVGRAAGRRGRGVGLEDDSGRAGPGSTLFRRLGALPPPFLSRARPPPFIADPLDLFHLPGSGRDPPAAGVDAAHAKHRQLDWKLCLPARVRGQDWEDGWEM